MNKNVILWLAIGLRIARPFVLVGLGLLDLYQTVKKLSLLRGK